MLISVKIIKLLSNLICDITHASFGLKLCFKTDESSARNECNLHEMKIIKNYTNIKHQDLLRWLVYPLMIKNIYLNLILYIYFIRIFLLEKYFRNIFVSLAHKSLVYKSRATRLRFKKIQPANAGDNDECPCK